MGFGGPRINLSELYQGQMAGSCKHGNKTSGPIQFGKYVISQGTVSF